MKFYKFFSVLLLLFTFEVCFGTPGSSIIGTINDSGGITVTNGETVTITPIVNIVNYTPRLSINIYSIEGIKKTILANNKSIDC